MGGWGWSDEPELCSELVRENHPTVFVRIWSNGLVRFHCTVDSVVHFLQRCDCASAAAHCSSRLVRASLMARRTSLLFGSFGCDAGHFLRALAGFFFFFELFSFANLLP